jgi:hypothetical protein
MDYLIKEAIEIHQHLDDFDRGFLLSQTWKFILKQLWTATSKK